MIQPKNLKIPKLFSGNFLFKDGVVKYPHNVLREVATEVTPQELSGEVKGWYGDIRDVITQMSDTVARFASCAGLAATQIGVAKRIICLRRENGDFFFIINPVIVEASGFAKGTEGCLSTPNLWGVVERNTEVLVSGLDSNFEPHTEKFTNFSAVVIQHEIDHLDGIMFFDRADPKSLVWKSSVLGTEKPATFEKST